MATLAKNHEQLGVTETYNKKCTGKSCQTTAMVNYWWGFRVAGWRNLDRRFGSCSATSTAKQAIWLIAQLTNIPAYSILSGLAGVWSAAHPTRDYFYMSMFIMSYAEAILPHSRAVSLIASRKQGPASFPLLKKNWLIKAWLELRLILHCHPGVRRELSSPGPTISNVS